MKFQLWMVILLLLVCVRSHAAPAAVPEGLYIGLTAPGSDDKNADDQGPPRAVKERMLARTGRNLTGLSITWKDCLPEDPGESEPNYDFSVIDERAEPVPEGWACIMKMHLNEHDSGFWANKVKQSDPERFWKLASHFWTASAKYAREKYGIRYFHAPGNEPSLSMDPNWHHDYVAQSNRFYDAVKAANSDNQVIIGALVVGDTDHVGALYAAGAKDHFDILDIHAYGGRIGRWPKTSRDNPSVPVFSSPEAPKAQFVSIGQIMEAHAEMERHGDGHKKIFLGEGWACFPLPDDIEQKADGRDTTYTPAQIEHYRQSVLVGYRNLITPREGYDPKWLWGALYFTMNDFWGSMHWKDRAQPVMEDGKIHHWMLDGVYIPYSPHALDPKYRPWGLIDANGAPKGDIIYNFPPYIPKVEITGAIEDGLKTVKKGTGYRINITATNNEEEPITDVVFGIYATGAGWRDRTPLDIPFVDMDSSVGLTLEPGQSASHRFAMTIQPDFDKDQVRAYAEVYYKWRGRPYYADAWINFEVED